jgi:hypothetical protein
MYPFVLETMQLLDMLFPDRTDSIKHEGDKKRATLELEKRKLYETKEQDKVAFVAERLLPKIFYVYENNITSSIRIKTLQIIDKIISLFNEELLKNFIEPYSFAKFIYSNLRSLHPTSIIICLQMVEKLIKSNPYMYTLPMIREGVSQFILKLSTTESFEKTIGVKAVALKEDKTDLLY